METKPISKTRKITAWVLVVLLTAIFLLSASTKFLAIGNPDAEMYKNFIKWGLSGNLMLIGAIELISAILFLIPRTSVIGMLLLTAHFGGAMATHLEHNEMSYIPVIATIIFLIWLAQYLRNPEILQSFFKN